MSSHVMLVWAEDAAENIHTSISQMSEGSESGVMPFVLFLSHLY